MDSGVGRTSLYSRHDVEAYIDTLPLFNDECFSLFDDLSNFERLAHRLPIDNNISRCFQREQFPSGANDDLPILLTTTNHEFYSSSLPQSPSNSSEENGETCKEIAANRVPRTEQIKKNCCPILESFLDNLSYDLTEIHALAQRILLEIDTLKELMNRKHKKNEITINTFSERLGTCEECADDLTSQIEGPVTDKMMALKQTLKKHCSTTNESSIIDKEKKEPMSSSTKDVSPSQIANDKAVFDISSLCTSKLHDISTARGVVNKQIKWRRENLTNRECDPEVKRYSSASSPVTSRSSYSEQLNLSEQSQDTVLFSTYQRDEHQISPDEFYREQNYNIFLGGTGC